MRSLATSAGARARNQLFQRCLLLTITDGSPFAGAYIPVPEQCCHAVRVPGVRALAVWPPPAAAPVFLSASASDPLVHGEG